MANTVQDEIYQSFLEVSRQQTADMTQATQSLAALIGQANAVRSDLAQQAAWKAGTSNVSGGSGSGNGSGGGTAATGSGGGSVLSTVFDVFKSGLSVSPVVNGILSLFGGGSAPAPAPLVKYALPAAINFQAAEVNGGIANTDYDQAGMARAYEAPTVAPASTAAGRPTVGETAGGTAANAPAPQITVNVQAMDARSFMDRSNEIALAVRDAMLNLNAINDVVGDL
jgi:hypothetical protein